MSEDIHKWSDGRYALMFDEHTFFVFDNEKEKRMTALKVTKKLNEQQATITKLKELNDDKGKKIISLIRTNKTLKEENDTLKEINKDKEQDVLHLYKKNKQFKEELNNLKKDETMLYHYYTLARYGGD